ncbi:MAG: CopG family transcriptional regulator [Thermodesulfovibrionia bacterium]|nr:CopG family transcriptional regulator [Thermodesulfovibrionia bacterium]
MSFTAIKRIGISIPDSILKELQQMVPERKRSEYIVRALQERLEEEKKKMLREEMVKGYKANAGIDAATAEEWRPLEEEAVKFIGVKEPKTKPYRRKTGVLSKKR